MNLIFLAIADTQNVPNSFGVQKADVIPDWPVAAAAFRGHFVD